jgi:transcription-repair coupling factor (superfamily II helicase)
MKKINIEDIKAQLFCRLLKNKWRRKMSKEKNKIDSSVIDLLDLIKKYSHFFEENTEDNNYLRIRKDFPFSKLEDQELRLIIFIMLAVHCGENDDAPEFIRAY